jgi:hypothetical protein
MAIKEEGRRQTDKAWRKVEGIEGRANWLKAKEANR